MKRHSAGSIAALFVMASFWVIVLIIGVQFGLAAIATLGVVLLSVVTTMGIVVATLHYSTAISGNLSAGLAQGARVSAEQLRIERQKEMSDRRAWVLEAQAQVQAQKLLPVADPFWDDDIDVEVVEVR